MYMATILDAILDFVIMVHLNAKITHSVLYSKKPVYWHAVQDYLTKNKVDFLLCTCNLGFMQIVRVTQSCKSGIQARFVLEQIFITNKQKKNFIVLSISRL